MKFIKSKHYDMHIRARETPTHSPRISTHTPFFHLQRRRLLRELQEERDRNLQQLKDDRSKLENEFLV